jgi:hypothetical protein
MSNLVARQFFQYIYLVPGLLFFLSLTVRLCRALSETLFIGLPRCQRTPFSLFT